MIYIVVFLLLAGVILLGVAPGNIMERLSDMGLALVVSSIVLYASHVREERKETNRRVFMICVVVAITSFVGILIIKNYVGGISMGIEHWGLVVSILGIIVTSVLAILVYKWTRRRTEETMEFMGNLIIDSAGDPETVRRLLKDLERMKTDRGKVCKGSDGKYFIAWKP